MKKVLKGGRMIDPSQKIDDIKDVLIVDGKIADIKDNIELSEVEKIDISGKILTPGLIDIHVHFREPGYEYKEDIESGSKSAVAGGFTAVACMPNTNPPIDNAALVEFVRNQGLRAGKAKVLPIGCVSKGMKGKEITEMGDMVSSGAVAFSDDGKPVANGSLLRQAMVYAAMFNKVVIDHCEETSLFEGGQINEGYTSTLLGLTGIPKAAEEIMVARNIILAKEMGTRIHIAHVSTKGSVELIRRAKADGVKVTCEVTPHHLILTEEAVQGFDTMAKVNPPLRTAEDVTALISGLKDGTIDAVVTDHAPHHMDEKDVEFDQAAFGLVGLETSLGLMLTHMVSEDKLSMAELIDKMTCGPARVLDLDLGTLKIGSSADITVIDPELMWTVDRNEFVSKARNTPFDGWKLRGKAIMTIVDGELVHTNA